MDKPRTKNESFLSVAALTIILAILVIRTSYTESLQQTAGFSLGFFGPVKSLSLSWILIFVLAGSVIYSLCKFKIKYFFTGIEFGLVLFTAAAIIATLNASNVRDSITYSTTLIVPIAICILLVNLLSAKWKIQMVLVVLTGLGVLNALICADQFFFSNKGMVAQYEQSPDEQLSRLGIEDGTLEHFMYEHRLYSNDIKGFFTTGNSAGSFFLLSAAAVFMLISGFHKKYKQYLMLFMCSISSLIIILAGLILTHSKGAIVGTVLTTAIFVSCILFRKLICRFKKTILLLFIIAVVMMAGLVISYGIKNDTLPGGNSMMVRWQYWKSSTQMFADNIFGIGGGNFAKFYTAYKIPSAIETVSDPHNFVLSILCQYGFVGLAGFILAISWPMLRIIFTRHNSDTNLSSEKPPKKNVNILIAITIMLLTGWIFCKDVELGTVPEVIVYLSLVFYIVPASIFFITSVLLWPRKAEDVFGRMNPVILICAIIGFLVHNLIDFAIFEPGVWMSLWVVVAVIIAADKIENNISSGEITLIKPVKLLLSSVILIVVVGGFYFGFIMPASSAVLLDKAMKNFSLMNQPKLQIWPDNNDTYNSRTMDNVNILTQRAAIADPMSPVAYSAKGKLFEYATGLIDDKAGSLNIAKGAFLNAINRDIADYKNYENLSHVDVQLEQITHNKGYLTDAFGNAQRALYLYPGNADIHFSLAQIAEQLGEFPLAIQHYRQAVEIEDGFGEQFKKMYPRLEPVSRLGREKYEQALRKIAEIEKSD